MASSHYGVAFVRVLCTETVTLKDDHLISQKFHSRDNLMVCFVILIFDLIWYIFSAGYTARVTAEHSLRHEGSPAAQALPGAK